MKVYLATWAALLLLTAATVRAALFDLGAWNLPVALGIAGVKAALVTLYFMHARHSLLLTKLVVAAGLAWLALLIGFTLTDYATR